jgi:hypothetical protein
MFSNGKKSLEGRVEKLEQLILGLGEDISDNRIDETISFVRDTAVEVGKMELLIEKLLSEMKNHNIIDDSKINNLKNLTAIESKLSNLKTRLSDVIRRENELSDSIPAELKETTCKTKEILSTQINLLEQEIKKLVLSK